MSIALTDRFTKEKLDLSKWGGLFGAPQPYIRAEKLKLDILPNSTTYAGLLSVATYTLTDNDAFIELVNAGDQTIGTYEAYPIEFYKDTNNRLIFLVTGGNVLCIRKVGGVQTTVASFAYVPATHRWFRLREASGTFYFETSIDGVTWTVRHSEATPFVLTGIQIAITAGSYAGGHAGTAMLVDNLNVVPNPTPSFAVTANESTGFSITVGGGAPDVPVNIPVPSEYAVLTEHLNTVPSDYFVRTEVVFVIGSGYHVLTEVVETVPVDYKVISEQGVALPADYAVVSEALDSVPSSYGVLLEVFIPVPADYAVQTEVANVVGTEYYVLAEALDTVASTYGVKTEVVITLPSEYVVFSVTEVLIQVPTTYTVKTEVGQTVGAEYAIKTEAGQAVSAEYAVNREVYIPVPSTYAVVSGALVELPTTYAVNSTNLVVTPADYAVQSAVVDVLPASYAMFALVTSELITLPCAYRVWRINRGETEVYAPVGSGIEGQANPYPSTGDKYPATASPYTPNNGVY